MDVNGCKGTGSVKEESSQIADQKTDCLHNRMLPQDEASGIRVKDLPNRK